MRYVLNHAIVGFQVEWTTEDGDLVTADLVSGDIRVEQAGIEGREIAPNNPDLELNPVRSLI